jgi:hypothetical protein
LIFALDSDRKSDDNDRNGTTAHRYEVAGYPTVVLIERAGKIAFHSGDPGGVTGVRAVLRELGLRAEDCTEEDMGRVLERFFERTIENVLVGKE